MPSENYQLNFRENLTRSRAKKIAFISAGSVICFILALYSVTLGTYSMSMSDAFCALFGIGNVDPTTIHIVRDLRLPRILGALICGFALAVCGAAMQSMLKNPLADPYTMGISSGAGFGAALAIIAGFELVAGGGIVINAFIFSLIPAAVITLITRIRKPTPTMMVLCGIALTYVFSALTQLFMIIADPDDMSAVYQWTIGTLDTVSPNDLATILFVTVLGSMYIMYMSNQLNILGMGDESAKSLGIDVEKRRLILLLVISLVAATVVSFTGVIGFVGLVAPHIVRTVLGADNRYLVPASGVVGAAILLISDIVCRWFAIYLNSHISLPVGVITACLGGPLFVYLLIKSRKEAWS